MRNLFREALLRHNINPEDEMESEYFLLSSPVELIRIKNKTYKFYQLWEEELIHNAYFCLNGEHIETFPSVHEYEYSDYDSEPYSYGTFSCIDSVLHK